MLIEHGMLIESMESYVSIVVDVCFDFMGKGFTQHNVLYGHRKSTHSSMDLPYVESLGKKCSINFYIK